MGGRDVDGTSAPYESESEHKTGTIIFDAIGGTSDV
jgi:hypothetical protein